MRNHCNTISTWNYTAERNRPIGDLLREGSHTIETWGNAGEGFAVYLVDSQGIGLQVSSGVYTRRCDADAAVRFAFDAGDAFRCTIGRGRNFP